MENMYALDCYYLLSFRHVQDRRETFHSGEEYRTADNWSAAINRLGI